MVFTISSAFYIIPTPAQSPTKISLTVITLHWPSFRQAFQKYDLRDIVIQIFGRPGENWANEV